MSESFKRLKGFADIYGQAGVNFSFLETWARKIFPQYGFEELRTPIMEATGLFQRSIGSETDVVQKEMFTFPDRKGRSITLRPEATAGVLRAVIEEKLVQPGQVGRFFSIGPMFRYERPQKGRMRQFHQINCECLGTDSPYADAELICMLLDFLKSLGLDSLKLKLNTLGCKECRPQFLQKLRDYFAHIPADSWCEDCKKRVVANPLRVLDCKNARCHQNIMAAPRLIENNCEQCTIHFEKTLQLLASQSISWEVDHHLVRGLDYYQRVTFEVVSDQIGAQTAVAGGGRYDGLLGQLGGPDLPGVGFACGMERLALLLGQEYSRGLDFYMLSLEMAQRQQAFILAQQLRGKGFSGEMNYQGEGMKSLMRKAARSGARFCLIIGPDEMAAGQIIMKNMATGEQQSVAQHNLALELEGALKNVN